MKEVLKSGFLYALAKMYGQYIYGSRVIIV